MRPDAPAPGSPEDWLRHARSDLAVASQRVAPEVLLETLCFHAQQAAEKSLKAVLVERGIVFPHTHDLARLVTLVKTAGIHWPDRLDAAVALSEYAVEARYPGPTGEITDEEYGAAVRLAREVLNWAEAVTGSART